MSRQKLTQTLVSETPFLASGQVFLRDSELRGFGLRVGKTSKAYVVEARTNGKARRVNIGDASRLTVTEARRRAKFELANMAAGIDTNAQKAKAKAEAITLEAALEVFLSDKRGQRKISTLHQYSQGIRLYFPQLLKNDLRSITPNEFVKAFDRVLEINGEASAALATRIFSAVWNHIRAKLADEDGNPILRETPTKRVKALNKIPKINCKQGHVRDYPRFFTALAGIHSADFPVFLELAIRTGARRGEISRLRWSDVNLQQLVFTFRDTKNGTHHALPMSSQIENLFLKLKTLHGDGEYIWGDRPLLDPRKSLMSFRKGCGESLTIHDMRRSFNLLCFEANISWAKHKKLVNHKSNDVTDAYIPHSPELLRGDMQKVSDLIDKKRFDT